MRITLVENLRRLAELIEAQQSAARSADVLVDRVLGIAGTHRESPATILSNLDEVPWSVAFAAELARRLRDNDPDVIPALRWLNDKLTAESTTIDQIVHDDFQRRSATNLTVRNVITSMRLVSMINWAEFVEGVSPIDAVLRDASDFAAMDFSTRDRYRRAVEELARESGRDEVDVAKRAVAAARRTPEAASESDAAAKRECDPGYYLIAQGRRGFEKELGCRVPLGTRLFQLNSDLGVMSYVGMVAFVTTIVLALALFTIAYFGAHGWQLLALGIAGLVPASDIAVAIVNSTITRQVGGQVLPGLELQKGITPELRTIVVVPTLLCDVSGQNISSGLRITIYPIPTTI